SAILALVVTGGLFAVTHRYGSSSLPCQTICAEPNRLSQHSFRQSGVKSFTETFLNVCGPGDTTYCFTPTRKQNSPFLSQAKLTGNSVFLRSSNLFVRYAKTLRVDPPSDLQIRDAGDGSVRWSASSGVAVRLRWSGCGEICSDLCLCGAVVSAQSPPPWCLGAGGVFLLRSVRTSTVVYLQGVRRSRFLRQCRLKYPTVKSSWVLFFMVSVANIARLATILSEEPPSCSKRWSAWTLVVLHESPESSSLSVATHLECCPSQYRSLSLQASVPLRRDKAAIVQPVLLGVECSRHGVQSGCFRYELSGLFTQLCA
ncbi:unnamed protein product, partial [Brassica oleracea]